MRSKSKINRRVPQGQQQQVQAYEQAQGKYQDVLRLEQSILELHQMFVDFALLTEQQGELLDQIEFQVKAASDYIDEGNSEMVKAIEIQKSIRRNQCILLIIVLVIIGVIVVVIILTTGDGSGSDDSDSESRRRRLAVGGTERGVGAEALLDVMAKQVANLRGSLHIEDWSRQVE